MRSSINHQGCQWTIFALENLLTQVLSFTLKISRVETLCSAVVYISNSIPRAPKRERLLCLYAGHSPEVVMRRKRSGKVYTLQGF